MSHRTRIDRWLGPFGEYLQEDYMRHLGIANSRRISKTYNRVRYGKRRREHCRATAAELDVLLAENRARYNEPEMKQPIRIRDGYALDRSGSLPHLDRLLAETGRIVNARGGRKHSDIQRPYFRNLMFPGDDAANPSFYDFAISSAVVDTVTDYMGTIPVLSHTRPPGIRMMESNANLDDRVDPPLEASQLFHLDVHDTPLVYLIVLVDDVTEECGPWSFLPASASDLAQKKLSYQKKGVPYRIPDEVMYQHVDPKELIVFTGKKGDILFIDSSRCYHFGSRNAVRPRFLMMYAYTTPCRADLTLTYLDPYPFPVTNDDSRLRRMILDPLR